jgi:hypothetical protein
LLGTRHTNSEQAGEEVFLAGRIERLQPQTINLIYCMRFHHIVTAAAGFLCAIITTAVTANGQTLRVVTYNINADTVTSGSGIGTVDGGTGLTAVLQAIGQEHLSDGNAQPIDVLALEELHYDNPSISQTLTYLVGQLNSIYGAGTYAADTFVDGTSGNDTGNGPSGLIYNTHTIVDLGAKQIGSASGSGAPRAPMRYTLQPVGGAAYSQFYLYVSHAKSGTDSGSANRRNIEAGELRTDAAGLTDSYGFQYAHAIYTGDFNIDGSSEQTYQTMIAASPNPSDSWTDGSGDLPLISEKATALDYRDDLQLITKPDQTMPGLQLISGTITPFGNNGSVAYGKTVTTSSNTALSDLSNRTTILSDLTTATDHLPVVADYTIVPPGDFNRDGHVNAADIPAMMNALANIPAYESATGLNAQQLEEIGDVNGDGVFNNADVQALINLLQAGGGSTNPVPEPSTFLLAVLVLGLLVFTGRLS